MKPREVCDVNVAVIVTLSVHSSTFFGEYMKLAGDGTLELSDLVAPRMLTLGGDFCLADEVELSLVNRVSVDTDGGEYTFTIDGSLSLDQSKLFGSKVTLINGTKGVLTVEMDFQIGSACRNGPICVDGAFENWGSLVIRCNTAPYQTRMYIGTNLGVPNYGTIEFTGNQDTYFILQSGALVNYATISTNSVSGAKASIQGNLENHGTIDVLENLSVSGASFDNESDGVINGDDTLDLSGTTFASYGKISPGTSTTPVATLTIEGPLPQDTTTEDASVDIQIGGPDQGSTYDYLDVKGGYHAPRNTQP